MGEGGGKDLALQLAVVPLGRSRGRCSVCLESVASCKPKSKTRPFLLAGGGSIAGEGHEALPRAEETEGIAAD